MDFEKWALYCEETYGSDVSVVEGKIDGFSCPVCGSWIEEGLMEVSETENGICPICWENFNAQD